MRQNLLKFLFFYLWKGTQINLSLEIKCTLCIWKPKCSIKRWWWWTNYKRWIEKEIGEKKMVIFNILHKVIDLWSSPFIKRIFFMLICLLRFQFTVNFIVLVNIWCFETPQFDSCQWKNNENKSKWFIMCPCVSWTESFIVNAFFYLRGSTLSLHSME